MSEHKVSAAAVEALHLVCHVAVRAARARCTALQLAPRALSFLPGSY